MGTLVTQGDLAVEAVKESEQPYDLIFMDLHMPVMGGIEACKLIREIESDHYPQIIACTANAQNDVKSQFTKLGAFAFIPKPINVKFLLRLWISFILFSNFGYFFYSFLDCKFVLYAHVS